MSGAPLHAPVAAAVGARAGLMPSALRLLLALALWMAPGIARAQARPAPPGIELGLTVGRFPSWTATSYSDDGVGDRRFPASGLVGATLAVFPVRQLGIRGAVETTGLRFYSEDSGYDLWRLSLEARPATVGPLALFAGAGVGRLSQTNGISFRLLNVGGGAQLKLFGAFSLFLAADLVWRSDPRTSSSIIQRTEVDLDPLSWRGGLVWRIVRFGR